MLAVEQGVVAFLLHLAFFASSQPFPPLHLSCCTLLRHRNTAGGWGGGRGHFWACVSGRLRSISRVAGQPDFAGPFPATGRTLHTLITRKPLRWSEDISKCLTFLIWVCSCCWRSQSDFFISSSIAAWSLGPPWVLLPWGKFFLVAQFLSKWLGTSMHVFYSGIDTTSCYRLTAFVTSLVLSGLSINWSEDDESDSEDSLQEGNWEWQRNWEDDHDTCRNAVNDDTHAPAKAMAWWVERTSRFVVCVCVWEREREREREKRELDGQWSWILQSGSAAFENRFTYGHTLERPSKVTKKKRKQNVRAFATIASSRSCCVRFNRQCQYFNESSVSWHRAHSLTRWGEYKEVGAIISGHGWRHNLIYCVIWALWIRLTMIGPLLTSEWKDSSSETLAIRMFKGSVERSRHERHFCSLLPYFLLYWLQIFRLCLSFCTSSPDLVLFKKFLQEKEKYPKNHPKRLSS